MNRYSFVIGNPEEVVKDITTRKVGRVKKAMVKKFGKKSMVKDTTVTVPRPRRRRAPRLTNRRRHQNCSICGFHIEDEQPEFQTVCNRCGADISRLERGIDDRDDTVIFWARSFYIVCIGFVLTWMWVNK